MDKKTPMNSQGFRVSNPVMNEKTFSSVQASASAEPMTMNGTIKKSLLLLAITIIFAVVGWQIANPVVLIGTTLVGLGIAIATSVKKEWSPFLAPTYAVVKGLFVGAVSYVVNEAVAESENQLIANGVVPFAVAGTLVVFGVMLFLYMARIIRVTETFRTVVIGATIAVFIVYLGSFLVSFLWPAVYNLPIYSSGPIGIIFSVLVIGLAAFNLALDFDLIEQGVQSGLPKYFEWYAGFALLVTLIWLYIEILRLLMKLANRR